MKCARLLGAITLAFAAITASARADDDGGAITQSLAAFVDAVNHGNAAAAAPHFAGNPSISEDAPPFHWSGPDAVDRWMSGMAANAQTMGITGIDMHILPASRIEVSENGAYAVVPGVLTFTMKDGHSTHAEGLLTFVLRRADGSWKIETMTWTGPRDR